MVFGRERSGRQLSRPASTMSSGGSLLLLLLLLFWSDVALSNPVTMYTDYFEGNCGLVPYYEKLCGQPEYRFFYNVVSKKCESYVDYGCPFRRNRFNTMEQCEQYCAPKNFCHLPPGESNCRSYRERWFFDRRTKSCKSLSFKGCTGNQNNFERKWMCERQCL
ncbi:kunitz-type serine protease inhibitor bitisilin-1-like [Crotalus tigris]|uniref:kunitz-type serine protease inhibitor bitisilin-1-like n=1 Tax=Crotalus tigris TaxID=88082 RepID=UPI00192FB079|nr:kunitz-type serine protease inhibitor bitisilin-1-like [Crotalus tigris]